MHSHADRIVLAQVMLPTDATAFFVYVALD